MVKDIIASIREASLYPKTVNFRTILPINTFLKVLETTWNGVIHDTIKNFC